MSEKHEDLKIYTKLYNVDMVQHTDEYDLPSDYVSEKTTWSVNGQYRRRNGNYDLLLDDQCHGIKFKIWKKGSIDSPDYWFYHIYYEEYSIFYDSMQRAGVPYQEFILIIIQI